MKGKELIELIQELKLEDYEFKLDYVEGGFCDGTESLDPYDIAGNINSKDKTVILRTW